MSIFTEVINNLFCVVLFDRLLRKVDRIYNNNIFKKLKPVANGEGKSRNEFAEWHVAWLAE